MEVAVSVSCTVAKHMLTIFAERKKTLTSTHSPSLFDRRSQMDLAARLMA